MKLLLVISLVSCMPNNESQVQTNQGVAGQQSWFKTPEKIKNTIEGYGIFIDRNAHLLYFDKLAELYGGKNIHQHETILVEPSGIYLLALDALSKWLSCQLLDKEDESKGAVFGGSWLSQRRKCDPCYKDNSKEWCDCDDGITLDDNFDDHPDYEDKELKKRIMHNIQDIGDFLNIAIDDKLPTYGYEHAADYLYQRVFIPNLSSESSCIERLEPQGQMDTKSVGNDDNQDKQADPPHREAWRLVIHKILMSGPFYLNL